MMATDGLVPDLTLLLTLAADVGLGARRPGRVAGDRIRIERSGTRVPFAR